MDTTLTARALTVTGYEAGSLFVVAYPGTLSVFLKADKNQWINLNPGSRHTSATDYNIARLMRNFTAAGHPWWVY